MNDFTASTGHVFAEDDGGVRLLAQNGRPLVASDTPVGVALKEYVEHVRSTARAEEDTHLGRWRWPENPDFVVYPVGDGVVDVLRESSVSESTRGPGFQASITRADAATWGHDYAQNFYRAAAAYFDAHPEPEPWHDAKEGELWVLTVDGEECAAMTRPDREGVFGGVVFEVAGRGPFGRVATAITAGRRIFPEAAS